MNENENVNKQNGREYNITEQNGHTIKIEDTQYLVCGLGKLS